jgi:hypothetical protein
MKTKKLYLITSVFFILSLAFTHPAQAKDGQNQADFYQQLVEVAKVGTLGSLVLFTIKKMK